MPFVPFISSYCEPALTLEERIPGKNSDSSLIYGLSEQWGAALGRSKSNLFSSKSQLHQQRRIVVVGTYITQTPHCRILGSKTLMCVKFVDDVWALEHFEAIRKKNKAPALFKGRGRRTRNACNFLSSEHSTCVDWNEPRFNRDGFWENKVNSPGRPILLRGAWKSYYIIWWYIFISLYIGHELNNCLKNGNQVVENRGINAFRSWLSLSSNAVIVNLYKSQQLVHEITLKLQRECLWQFLNPQPLLTVQVSLTLHQIYILDQYSMCQYKTPTIPGCKNCSITLFHQSKDSTEFMDKVPDFRTLFRYIACF